MGKRDDKITAVKIPVETDDADWTHEVIVVTPPPAPVTPKMPFSQWFHRKVKSGAVRSYEEAAIKVFFAELGLKDEEDPNAYNKAFERY